MKQEFMREVIDETIESITATLSVKATEYVRNNDAMHNFEQGACITGQTREQVLYGFALKHHISIADMRDDIARGHLPTKEKVLEKFGDAINYLILEKASILDKIDEENREADDGLPF